MKGEHVVIDGYNLLHAHPSYAALLETDIDAARARLVADLAGYAQGGPRTIAVFDGAGNPASDGAPHHVGALTVVFSAAGTSADAVIEGLARRFRDRGERVLVVTSDNATRETVTSGTVSVRSSQQFAAELLAESASREGSSGRPRRMPVSRRIAPDVAEELSRWARGAGKD